MAIGLGLAVAAGGALLGWLLHLVLPWLPWLTASLLLGVLLGQLRPIRPALDRVLKPGLGVAAKRLLRIGIVLLGLKLSLVDIAGLGWVAFLAIVLLVLAAFGVTYAIARLLRLPGDEPALLAAGFAICGVSAIGAMSAARRSPDADAGAPTALVTLYGSLAIVVLPLLAVPLGLSGSALGHWIGASVHDVGQVVATAGVAGSAALATALVVKLTRVLLLAPLVAVAAIRARRRAAVAPDAERGPRPRIVPLFIVGFVALMLVRTLWPGIPDPVLTAADTAQSILLAMALTAIGASLRLERIARSGARSLLAGALSWAVILLLALGAVALSATP